jgi:hypothetical protein
MASADSAPIPWPHPDLAAKLNVDMSAEEWPGAQLEPSLGPEGTTELTPAPTAQQHAAGSRPGMPR